jgi:hypothetical protein
MDGDGFPDRNILKTYPLIAYFKSGGYLSSSG